MFNKKQILESRNNRSKFSLISFHFRTVSRKMTVDKELSLIISVRRGSIDLSGQRPSSKGSHSSKYPHGFKFNKVKQLSDVPSTLSERICNEHELFGQPSEVFLVFV